MKINLRQDKSQVFYLGERVRINHSFYKINREGIIIPNDWEKEPTHSDKFKVSFENGYVGWFFSRELEKIHE